MGKEAEGINNKSGGKLPGIFYNIQERKLVNSVLKFWLKKRKAQINCIDRLL